MGAIVEGSSIDGFEIIDLNPIKDERGMLMHMLRSDSEHFQMFGEVYFSVTNPGVVKGWKKHLEMTQHFTVPVGTLKLVILDQRKDSKTKGNVLKLTLNRDNYSLVKIPPMLWYSFQASEEGEAMIANLTDLPHEPEESMVEAIETFNELYNWS